MPFAKQPDPVVVDPVKDAENQYHTTFSRVKTRDMWKKWEVRCTTDQFGKLGGGFMRHCGPTALTNVILTFNERYHVFHKEHCPELIFRRVAQIGMHNGYYWNTDFLRRFGGTYDSVTGIYIRRCLRYFGIPAKVSGFFPLEAEDFKAELADGSLLYLQLHRHPTYGDHHLVCFGYTELESADHKERKIYLIVADGWSEEVRYLDADTTWLSHGYRIKCLTRAKKDGNRELRLLI